MTGPRTALIPGFRAESPLGLAALRIALAVTILISPELRQAPDFAAGAQALRLAPEGLGWALRHVPIEPELARAAQLLLVLACVAAIFGVAARLALLVVTCSGLYVFGLSQLSGAVIHDMHLLWLSALLAVSPCADALSWHSWRGARARPPLMASLAYGVPVQLARVLLGIVYWFPGFWKLRTSGLAWITSDNLRNQLYWKWYEHGAAPTWLRVDRLPGVLHAAALAVVVFELSFIALIWTRRGRLWAAAGGVAFHLASQWLMGISFISLMLCYVVLLDWDAIARASGAPPPTAASTRSTWAAALLGSVLIVSSATQGARAATQAWPIGCYPTFDRVLGDAIADLRIEVVRADGSTLAVPDGPSSAGAPRSPQDWGRAWQLAGFYGQPPDATALRAYWQHLQHDPRAAAAAASGVSLRFYAASYAVQPERRGQAPLAKRLLAELPLPQSAH
jgi:hypothetical protein